MYEVSPNQPYNVGRWSRDESVTMMSIALGVPKSDVPSISDHRSILKAVKFNKYSLVTKVLNRSAVQCRTHWQKVRKKLIKKLNDQIEQRKREKQEIERAAGLLMDLRNITII